MRRTYHYDEASKSMVEGPAPRKADQGSGDGWRFSDRLYSSAPFKAHDGTIIDTRKKHREYMKRNSLTTADDYTKYWEKSAKERAAFYTNAPDPSRKEDIIRAFGEKHG